MNVMESLSMLRTWSTRRFVVAASTAVASVLVVGVPTALIKTPFFGREIPPTWWSWPALIVSSVLAGLLFATYVREDLPADDVATEGSVAAGGVAAMGNERATTRSGTIGGLLTFFAVGCPVCNKLVLIALGSAGAITWFEPVQPVLQVVAIGLLSWALLKRLEGERACRLTVSPVSTDA